MYNDFLETFPEFGEDNKDSVRKIDEEAMKSAKGKEAWRQFAAKYEGRGEREPLCRSYSQADQLNDQTPSVGLQPRHPCSNRLKRRIHAEQHHLRPPLAILRI